jgi:hypothetical protein
MNRWGKRMESARRVVGLKCVVRLEIRMGTKVGLLELDGEVLEMAESCGIGIP